jgi:hypothetical protein
LTVTTALEASASLDLSIEEVEDLDWRVVGKLPWRRVQLPGLVGDGGFESEEPRLRALAGLRGDEAVTCEDPPDRGDRGQFVDQAGE